MIAGIPKEKLVYTENEDNIVNYLSLENNKDIYILYDLYVDKNANCVKQKIIDRINGGNK